ncbi:NdvB protein [Thalassotalea litorea]|uniref:gluconokinase n=1 Tax=Thalassotalea litorea TaxID=2020715 RepID=A0A5R9ILG3_9GAMM|nr:gluconokinase, GntK/IdnK-type [Thalassotalea litorea]TLU66370.1 NdvB protein [Thalassotalea litorea]
MGQDDHPCYHIDSDMHQLHLTSPTRIPGASGYLYNPSTMLQVNCRGFANAIVMQPEPSSYSSSPVLEATTFIQPEKQHFAHHPGRFFYIKDETSNEIFSLPYEPVRQKNVEFKFTVGVDCIEWQVQYMQLNCHLKVTLDSELAVEVWQLNIENLSDKERKLSVYPAFSIGYHSWMNQSAHFDADLDAIIATSIRPYQKLADYDKVKALANTCFMFSDRQPQSWSANLSEFEGEGGIHNPDGVTSEHLGCEQAQYETPIAVQQHQVNLGPKQQYQLPVLFGLAKDKAQVKDIKQFYFADDSSLEKLVSVNCRSARIKNAPIQISTGDSEFDEFVSTWLPKQMDYHRQLQRLTTDPQTRNFLQDLIGVGFLDQKTVRDRILLALSQQTRNGALPDGILLNESAELKYINQVPHQDINVWLPITLQAYLDEHNDYAILEHKVPFADGEESVTVAQHLQRAMEYLISNLDQRKLSLIGLGDWCDPLNMAGPEGKGISTWLSLATSWALQITAKLIEDFDPEKAHQFAALSVTINEAVNQHCWDGQWYSRGITDAGKPFGVSEDEEGKIFLNPQSWAWLAGAVDDNQFRDSLAAIEGHLLTPFGTMMLAPAYTHMREDVGRLTQKFPGCAENGSVYNHASIFYIYGLYQQNQGDLAFSGLKQMLSLSHDNESRQQLGNFIPNYYRGKVDNLEAYAGRSSQLINTGTIAWYYRCIIEELFGLKGHKEGLLVSPKIPTDWKSVSVIRRFRGATIRIDYTQEPANKPMQLILDGKVVEGNIVKGLQQDTEYQLQVKLYLPVPEPVVKMPLDSDKSAANIASANATEESVATVQSADGIASTDNTVASTSDSAIDSHVALATMKPHQSKAALAWSEKQSNALKKYPPLDPELPNLFILMGVSGSGKSTLAEEFSGHYEYKYIDADSFHTSEAKKMMAEALPLTDEIRKPWIESIQSYLRSQARRKRNCVLAYSGLRKLQRQSFEELPFNVRAVFLKVDKDVLQKRLVQRKQHFFSEKLLMSQFKDFEKIKSSEPIVIIDGNQSLQEMVEQISFVMHSEGEG